MGTHPSNPSNDLNTGRTLLDLVQENGTLLSSAVSSKFGAKLPFLFKVLSINKALSIQAHPNKKLAEQLHARDPKNYPDDNHKPEMAIAITPFEGFCGFRPVGEIAHFLSVVPALRHLVGTQAADEFIKAIKGNEESTDEVIVSKNKDALKKLFKSLMSSTAAAIESAAGKLVDAAKADGDCKLVADEAKISTASATLAELITRTYGQFGADIGLFVLFFLNFVTMEPGEAMFLRADDIHAYIGGDIIECMAASDNVVRAGFTPKFKDVNTLVSMLTYDYAPIDEQKMTPTEYPYATLNRAGYSSGSEVMLYDPPIEEFSVIRSCLVGDKAKVTFEPLEGPSIVICTSGKGKISVGPMTQEIKEGFVYFVGASAELVLQSEGSTEDEFITFKAFCEVDGAAENGGFHI